MDKTIFIVDDNEVNRFMIGEILEDQYKVISLDSAEEMFEELKSVVPNLIIMNTTMPGISGYDAVKKLKESTEYADIPVIFISSSDTYSDEIRCFELGASDYITKPFDHTVLKYRVKARIK